MKHKRMMMRAWDDVAEEMYYSHTEQFDDSLLFRFSHFETETPIYMEWTGQNDMHNQPIFDGDYLIGKDRYTGETVRALMVWNQQAMAWRLDGVSSHTRKQASLLKLKEVEVIGNYYQTPKLALSEGNP
jgi:hypothetical protein